MPLKNINPTQTKSWKNLESHFVDIKNAEMKSLFLKDKNRKEKFTLSFNEMTLDYSKNRITEKTLENLLNLANESELADAIQKCFSGEKINVTENRAVLHTALRNQNGKEIKVDGKDVMIEVNEALDKIKAFSESVIS